MKTKGLKILYAGLILLVPLFGGCQENETPLEPGSTVSLDRIPENPTYASLPLIGTKWKLIGFVDSKLEMIKLAEPDSSISYTLIFEEDGLLDGYTSTNPASGKYLIERDSGNYLQISTFRPNTYINELFDGRNYIDTMNKVNSFSISTRGLSLLYEKDKYLLFKPIK